MIFGAAEFPPATRGLFDAMEKNVLVIILPSPPAIPKKKQLKPTDICAKIGCTEEVKKVMATESHNGSHSTAQKIHSLFGKEVDEAMTETELREKLIQQYTDLQRIKSAPDRDKEIEYQIKTVKAKLEAFGVVTEDLDIH